MHELEELRRRARERGVETHYHDIDGVLREASEEALRAMLGALECEGDDLPAWLPPVTVFWDGAGVLALQPPEGAERVTLTVTLEGGERFYEGRVLASLPAIDEGSAAARRVMLSRTLPFGYHRVRVVFGGVAQEAAIFSAPRRVFQGREVRSWGVFAPTYALHSERSLGIGDLADLEQLTAWVGQAGGATLATLPLTATFVTEPFDPSPYAPISRLFFSGLYLALDALPELSFAPASVRDALAAAQGDTANRGDSVDYPRVARLKRELSQQLAAVVEAHTELRAELDAWIKAHPDALHYARFVATHEAPGASFTRWQEEAAWLPAEHSSVRFQLYVQWRLSQQLAGLSQRALELGVGLYLDMPLGAHPSGYDAYRYRDALLTGCAQGAPPDTLFDGGQNWGFAPLHPRRSQQSAHAYFRASVASQMQHAEVLRIDHVMGLHRSYCVPDGLGAREGVYVRQPSAELYAVLTIESHRHQTYVVGEDLGTVPNEVREAMARHGIGRLHVAQYEVDAAASGALPENAIASLNTHDMPPFAAFHAARGGDRAQCEEALLAELHNLGASGARRVLVNLEDLWLETRPQNVPGTGPESPNWRGRLALSLAQIPHDPRVLTGVAALARTSQPAVSRAAGPRAAASVNASRATELDLYLFNEGTHERLFDILGAHPGEHEGAAGVFFAVWAPNAAWVSVLGSFNDWWPEHQPLFRQGASGVWSAFVPGARVGDLYKYRVVTTDGAHLDKADPFARRSELAPQTASIVHAHDYAWRDHEWMAARHDKQRVGAPVAIYELHLGSWRRRGDGTLLSYAEAAPLLVEHITRLGFTHVELLPIMEHPFYASWGYQITGFFAASSRYGTPEELMALVDALHAAGIGVILDWVPGHFPSDDFALARFDGTCLYEHEDPRRGVHPDWKSLIFNYGRREVQAFLISSAVYWMEKFHIDGLRVDGVASMLYLDYSRKAGEWIPNEHGGRENLDAIQFLRRLNEVIYGRHPDTQTTAEESTSWPMVSRPTWVGGLGFGFKWDLGWMNDVLRYFGRDPVHRRFHQEQLTFRSMYAFQENFVLPLSHDEVVHGKGSLLGKMPGDVWQKFANLRLLYAFMYAQPGHKLLFQGAELAPWDEWSHDRALDLGLLSWSTHQGIFDLLAALNRVYRQEPALHELDFVAQGFEWVETRNPEWSVLAFERIAQDGSRVLCVFNFTPVPREGYRVGVLSPGTWAEILNTDAGLFAGSGVGNAGAVSSDPVEAQGRAHSLALRLPPLGALYLRSPR